MISVSLHVVADSANVSQEGKLNLLGIFQRILASAFPATHPSLALVFTVEADSGDTASEHTLMVDLVDSDGKRIAKINGKIKFAEVKGKKATHNQIVNFNGLNFPKPGMYEFKIIINGEERAFVPLELSEIEKPKQ